MLYNKNVVRKVNDKKVLHKVRGRWLVMSAALLMAIGGGALASGHVHANADSVNASPVSVQSGANKSNDNINSTIQSLEQAPQANAPQSASAGSSATSASTNASSSASQSVVYQKTDGGSAASLHADAINAQSVASDKSTTLTNYVNSLNQRFPNQVRALNNKVNSANGEYTKDNSLANSYADLAKQPNFSSNVASLASKQGLTTEDYTNLLDYTYNRNSLATSSASVNDNIFHQVASAKNSLSAEQTPEAQAQNQASASIAQAQLNANKAEESGDQTVYNDLVHASNVDNNTNIARKEAYLNAQVADQVAFTYSGVDSATVSELANSLGFKSDSNSVNTDLHNLADKFNASASAYSFANASNSNVSVTSANNGSEFNNIKQVVSDIAAMNAYSNFSAYAPVSTVASASIEAASNAVMVASMAVSSASSTYTHYSNLAKIGGESMGSALDTVFSGSSANSYAGAIATLASADSSAESTALSNVDSTLSSVVGVAQNAASSTDDYYGDAVNLASNFSGLAKSASNVASDASAKLDNFYNGYNSAYNTNKGILAQAKAEATKDATLAQAYGIRVFNYAPKHITMLKDAVLHADTNYGSSKDSALQSLKRGTVLNVNGIGLDASGLVRYNVTVNGVTGFVTANPQYTQNTYLMYDGGATEKFEAVDPINEYSDSAFTNRVKGLDSGDTFSGVVVSEPDNNFNNNDVYGGFTRIKLSDGNYVTANTKFVSVVPESPANNNASQNNQSGQSNNTPLVSFD